MSTPGETTPGRATPGLRTPQFDHAGHRTPGETEPSAPAATGVAIDATGTTTLGTVDGDRDLVLDVVINATASDFNFQVTVGGETVFDSTQSPGGTAEETFQPDTEAFTDAVAGDVVFEVTAASGTSGATTDVTVNAESDDMA